jgi:hypothetical protein
MSQLRQIVRNVEETRMKVPKIDLQILFGAVVGANVLTMSGMNFWETPTKYLSVVYLTCMIAVSALMVRHVPDLPRLTKRQHGFCLLFGVALFLPRWPYLMEGFLGYAMNPLGDDIWHLQEMSSIVHTPVFPPRSTYDSSQYLSYYYAPWVLGAALYETGLLSTVKQALGITVLVYCLFFSYGVMYASRIAFSDARLRTVFLVVCVMYGGFDFFYWLSGLTILPSHSEWWAAEFGISVQYSNFFTLSLWVQQHTLSALVIAYTLHITSRFECLATRVLAGMFFLSALFSSIFVSIGATPLVIWYFTVHKLTRKALTTALTFLVFSMPLWWIFLGKPKGIGFGFFEELDPFWMSHRRAAFLVFLFIISLELMPLLATSFVSVIRERLISRAILFGLSTLFLISTFFISFRVGANYPMRGSIIPIFTLAYLATPVISEWFRNVRSAPLRVLTTAYLLGGILEYAQFWRMSLIELAESKTELNADILHFNEDSQRISAADVAIRAESAGYSWYLIERQRPARQRQHMIEDDIATMGSDNPYRITVSKMFRSIGRTQYTR